MIVADRDGVVIVPFEKIDAVIAAVRRVSEMEADLDARVAGGLRIPTSISELLASDKVEYVD
jgi:4-hydroxy-4-methyl-2-oxoglutarate aldolase